METQLGFVDGVILVVGAIALIVAIVLATLHRKAALGDEESLAGRDVGPWVLGLSAGATANTGFVLTGAVGLGYAYGAVACALPIGWFIGDLFFWYFLAHRINGYSHKVRALTLPNLIQVGSTEPLGRHLRSIVAVVLFLLLVVYLGSQWLSAGKVAAVVFNTSITPAVLVFGAVVTVYTAISGFRGAVYTDTIQAIFMFLLAAAAVALTLSSLSTGRIDFFGLLVSQFVNDGGLMLAVSALGFSAAAMGFNLGQPQMVTRWMSGRNSGVLKKARWIYMLFLQSTWLSFTLIGVALGYLSIEAPGSDPEQAMIVMFQQSAVPGMIGLLLLGGISTIASSASSGLAVGAEMLKLDVIRAGGHRWSLSALLVVFTALLSGCVCLFSGQSVLSLALTSVSLTGAAFGAVVLCLSLGRRYSPQRCGMAISAGIASGFVWKMLGFNYFFNESGVGLFVGLLVLMLPSRAHPTNPRL